ncbi:MAG TPA: porin [Planctomycetota bacterium]|nr:porin [Planctomycetota bacterium]
MRPMAGWAVMACAGLLGALPAAAQEATEGDLRKEVEALKAKVEALESEKKVEPAPKAEPAQLMKLDDDRTILDILAAETTLSGFVDTGVIFNMNRPKDSGRAGVGENVVMPFTNQARNFYLHNAQLNLKRDPTKELITGYNVEVMFGSDANGADTLDTSDAGDYVTLQEANISILAPFGPNGVTFTIGKFATFAGYEVIESKDNYNYTRSLPFFFAIPFTHTGVRAAYSFSDQIKVTLGVNNGWDVMNDLNDAKTFEAQLAVTPIPWLSLYGNFYMGAEQPKTLTTAGRTPGDDRMLIDIVAVASKIPGLDGFTFGLNVDIGSEEDIDSSVGASPGDDAEWFGLAVYGKYEINADWAVAVRFSMLSDDGATRLPAHFDSNGVPTTDENTASEVTFTVQRQISKDTIARVEVRLDMSDEDLFVDHNEPEDSQVILGGEVILTF